MKWFYPTGSYSQVTNPYGAPSSRYASGHHTGVDFAKSSGSVHAAADGKVVAVGWGGPYGNQIIIKHANGVFTQYAHLASTGGLRAGMTVKGGAQIGTIGATGTNTSGPHLHFELRRTKDYGSAISPMKLLVAAGDGNEYTPPPTGDETGDPDTGSDEGNDMSVDDYGYSRRFMRKYPEVAALIRQAAKNDWEVPKFQARLAQTEWWKRRTAAQRAFDQGITVDAKTWQKKIETMHGDLKDLATTLGVSGEKLYRLARSYVRSGMEADDAIDLLAARYKYQEKVVGRAGAIQQGVINNAAAYGLELSNDSIELRVRKALAAEDGWSEVVNGFTDGYREAAKNRYKAVADLIDKGQTVDDILQPYKETASRMLGMAPNMMKSWKPKWTEAISGDVAMNMKQWQTLLRTDSRYNWNAGPEAAEYYSRVGDMFGTAWGRS